MFDLQHGPVSQVSYGKLENPVTFICYGTSHKSDNQIKRVNNIQRTK